jgi:hypothetical protein
MKDLLPRRRRRKMINPSQKLKLSQQLRKR